MKKLLESWQRTLEQDEFKLSTPEILNEVTVLQLGLPAEIAEFINARLGNASREAKVKVGQMWKDTRIAQTMGQHALNAIGRYDDRKGGSADGTLIDNFSTAVVVTAMEHTREQGAEDAKEWPLDPEKSDLWQATSDKAGQIIRNFRDLIGARDATGADLMKAEKMAQRFFKKGINGTIPEGPYRIAHNITFGEAIQRGAVTLSTASDYERLFDYLNDDPDGKHYEFIKKYDKLPDAAQGAINELAGRENPDQVIKKYNDGYYWYDIGHASCDIEGRKMKHCGTGPGATTLYSLRSPNKDPNVEFGRDHWVTVAYNEKKKEVLQIKGQMNELPDKKYWQKIVDLLGAIDVKKIEERGQHANNKEGFLDFRTWLMSELQLGEAAWDEIKKELTNWVNKFQEEVPYRGISIGFRMEKDEDGVIRYFPLALFGTDFPADILNEHGKKALTKRTEGGGSQVFGQKFGENIAISLVGNEMYKYAPEKSSTIHDFYYKDEDPEIDENIVGPGARRGKHNAAWTREFSSFYDAKLFVVTPIDIGKVLGYPEWIWDGSAAIPSDRSDPASFANFFQVMKGVSAQEAEGMKEAIRSAMLDRNYIEGAMFNDIDQSIIHRELYTRGTLPAGTDPSDYRNLPTDWELERAIDEENDILENITATIPTIILNTAALLDEHDIPSVPGGLAGIKALFNFNVFGAELMKEMLDEAGSETEYERGEAPNQLYLFSKNPYESRPYVFAIDWALEIEPDTKDSIAKDFLHIVSKIDTKDKITDVAEKAFINMIKKKFPEDKLDEATIRMWKRAIL